MNTSHMMITILSVTLGWKMHFSTLISDGFGRKNIMFHIWKVAWLWHVFLLFFSLQQRYNIL